MIVEKINDQNIYQHIEKGEKDSKVAGATYLLEALATRQARGDTIEPDDLNLALKRYQKELKTNRRGALAFFKSTVNSVEFADKNSEG